jgi:hypothetical protein
LRVPTIFPTREATPQMQRGQRTGTGAESESTADRPRYTSAGCNDGHRSSDRHQDLISIAQMIGGRGHITAIANMLASRGDPITVPAVGGFRQRAFQATNRKHKDRREVHIPTATSRCAGARTSSGGATASPNHHRTRTYAAGPRT